MESHAVVKMGYFVRSSMLHELNSQSKIDEFLSQKNNMNGRILLALAHYLVKYSKHIDSYSVVLTDQRERSLPNGTYQGIIGHISRAEADVGVTPLGISEKTMGIVDFAYPFRFSSLTFATQKPDYEPQMFGILQTFPLSLWIAILTVLIVLSTVYYFVWKRKYASSKIFLHVLAVLVRQSSVVRASSSADNLLVYSWVAGAMILCLAYDSVFLSFLALPPVNQVEDIPQLASAVEKGDYHCIASPESNIHKELSISEQRNFKIIGEDMTSNNLSTVKIISDFIYGKSKQNLAFFTDTSIIQYFAGTKFVSRDSFLENAVSMMIRKAFCCKKLVDSFVHGMTASGLYFKYYEDKRFLVGLPLLLNSKEKDDSKRTLTITDVAPAFMILLSGWFVSFLVLIGERVSYNRKKPKSLKKKRKTKKNTV